MDSVLWSEAHKKAVDLVRDSLAKGDARRLDRLLRLLKLMAIWVEGDRYKIRVGIGGDDFSRLKKHKVRLHEVDGRTYRFHLPLDDWDETDAYVTRDVASDDLARVFEKLAGKLGFDAGKNPGGGGNDNSTHIYVYKKTDHTDESV